MGQPQQSLMLPVCPATFKRCQLQRIRTDCPINDAQLQRICPDGGEPPEPPPTTAPHALTSHRSACKCNGEFQDPAQVPRVEIGKACNPGKVSVREDPLVCAVWRTKHTLRKARCVCARWCGAGGGRPDDCKQRADCKQRDGVVGSIRQGAGISLTAGWQAAGRVTGSSRSRCRRSRSR